jgi:chromosomal replication initiation ATPase DnaA
MSFIQNPIRAPRTRMAMPAHLEAMITRPINASKFSQEGRRKRQVELSIRVNELREQQFAELRAIAEKKKLDDGKKAKVEELLERARVMLEENRHYTKHPMRFKRILAILCEEFKLNPEQVLSESRKRQFVDARLMLYFIMHRNFKNGTLSKIGRLVGGRDHTTVISGLTKVKNDAVLFASAENTEKIILAREFELYGNDEAHG